MPQDKPTTFTPALKRLSAVVILGAVMTILDTTIVNVAIHTLGRDLEVSVATIQWVATAYLLALSLVIPLTGWAVERFGARNLWFGALILFLAGSVLSGAAWSAGSLIAVRIVGTAVFAVILQRGLDAGHGAGAFATTFWWVLGATVLTALPALALARSPARTPAVAEPVAA